MRGERELAVPPLTLPNRGHLLPPERLLQYEAVRLFVECAQGVKSHFALTSQDATGSPHFWVTADRGFPHPYPSPSARERVGRGFLLPSPAHWERDRGRGLPDDTTQVSPVSAETHAAAVVGICRRVDGLPLAIELAAARIKALPPAEILGRLGNRLRLLTGGARELLARQQTFKNTIAWSHDLLA